MCRVDVCPQVFGHVVLFNNKEGEMKKVQGLAMGIVVLFVLSFVIPADLMAQGAAPAGGNDSDSRKAGVVLGTGGAGAVAGAGAATGVTVGTVAAGLAVVGVTAAVIAASSSSSTTPHH